MDIYGEQKWSSQKDKQKRYGGNLTSCEPNSESVFLLTFATIGKSKCPTA